jgi:hypothetical protein
VLGVAVSEKSWVYLLALQMALSDGAGSLLAAGSGLAAGLLYLREGSPLQRFRLPVAVEVVTDQCMDILCSGRCMSNVHVFCVHAS